MKQSELKHEWAVDPNAGWLRLWLFVYNNVEAHELTFCKLFWGFVFMPLMVVTWLPLEYLWKLAKVIWEWLGLAAEGHSLKTKERRLKRRREDERKAFESPKPPREPVLIPKVEAFASRAAMKLSGLTKIMGYIGLALGACLIAGIVGALVWSLIHFWPYTGYAFGGIAAVSLFVLLVLGLVALILEYPEVFVGIAVIGGIVAIVGAAIWAGVTWWAVTQSILIIGVAGIIAALFILAVAYATIRFGKEPAMEYIMRPTHEYVLRPVAKAAGTGGVEFATVMKIGYRSVKTNTCPRIKISGDERK